MHRRIKHHTHQRKTCGIKFIEISIDTSISWNSIPSFLNEDK